MLPSTCILLLALHPLGGVHGPVVGRQDHARCAEDGHGDARAGHELHHAVASLRGNGAEAADGGGAKALGGGAEERHRGVVEEVVVAPAVVVVVGVDEETHDFLNCFGRDDHCREQRGAQRARMRVWDSSRETRQWEGRGGVCGGGREERDYTAQTQTQPNAPPRTRKPISLDAGFR